MISDRDDRIAISKACREDLKEILALQKLAFKSEAELYNDFSIEPLTQTLESIEADFNNYVFLKAIRKSILVGSVKARETGEYCWIGRLIVSPDQQNNGIGKKLMKAIENEFSDTKKYLLCTGYRSSKNISLYRSLGYEEQELISDERNPELKMVKMSKQNRK